eukprot:scaffold3_cov273-Pinguiococcus_pyrenoidosus.AAC.4
MALTQGVQPSASHRGHEGYAGSQRYVSRDFATNAEKENEKESRRSTMTSGARAAATTCHGLLNPPQSRWLLF